MFDTHCHLNFSRFKKNVEEVIAKAHEVGVSHIVIPGTDVETSKKAIEIASAHDNLFAAVGVHPHHVYELKLEEKVLDIDQIISELETMTAHPKVMAIGEVGMDRHIYENTKYEEYNVDEKFIDLQGQLLKHQIQLAKKSKKSLILHNREAKADLLPIVESEWSSDLEGRAVFHCCEPDEELLKFAQDHRMFIGVDGDITYYPEKQEFIKKVPLEMLVLETDSPFLLPEPLRTQKLFPNKPEHIPMISQFIADLRGESVDKLREATTQNAKNLFQIA
ncbi:MAG: TatD family hydrolase [Patescibacteria group bacterium]